MASMTGNDPTRSTSSEEEPVLPLRQEPDAPQQAEDPGYLMETGQAAGEDGSVAPIIGGLPAVEGSAWDIGAPLEERGAGRPAEGERAEQPSHDDEHSGR